MLLSALLFFSCEEDLSTVGLPPDNNLGIFFAELPLNDQLSTIWVDSLNTRGKSIISVGQANDPYFGHIEAKNYSEVSLPALNPGASFDESATFDSLVVELRVNGLYGPNDAPVNVEVYRIEESIELVDGDEEAIYFSSASEQAIGEKLGQATFNFVSDSVNLLFGETTLDEDIPADSTIKANYYDTDERYIYMKQIKLDNSFGQSFFDRIKSEDDIFGDSVDQYIDYFKGLAFSSTSGNSIPSFEISSFSGMKFYYSELDTAGNKQTKVLRFAFSTARSYNNYTPNKNQGWSGSSFEINSFYTPVIDDEYVYAQGGTGILPVIDLSYLRNFTESDTAKNAVIQRAQIIIKNIIDLNNYDAPSQLSFYLTSPDKLAQGNYSASAIGHSLSPSQPLVAIYDAELRGYVADIPRYLRDLDLNLVDYDQVVIVPSNLTTNLRRFVVSKDDVSLHLYYTKPDVSQ
ncbi:DUF4270 family protein [Fulvivirga ligni]|uniref:DUF4270 family protein n=1 Tax=Fulvivirga ligni TaxID=2904246 RepID=UPI001F3D0C9D|nr:DUF4270 family protein [Fulvivirga ligni]UII22785.1 DUF4270 domain-containing protein [Fulvivirga ligni]